VRFSCSALHFTHVVCKNQPNKLFEVTVSMRDVSQRRVDIPHVYEYTYDISLTYARGYARDYVVLFRVTETIMLQLACQ
jgi:hypothetical protein